MIRFMIKEGSNERLGVCRKKRQIKTRPGNFQMHFVHAQDAPEGTDFSTCDFEQSCKSRPHDFRCTSRILSQNVALLAGNPQTRSDRVRVCKNSTVSPAFPLSYQVDGQVMVLSP